MSTETKNILITDRFTPEAWVTLETQPFIKIARAKSPTLENDDLRETHALLIRSRTHVDEALLQRAPKLQLIVTSTSGFDHIDLAATAKWGITVMYTPEANVASAAEMTWALLLACARKIPASHRQVKDARWQKELLTGSELMHKTLGIVGLGRIGSRVARIAKAFDMQVVAYDPYLDDEVFEKHGAERVAFEELLKRSDAITFHVPKTELSHHMLNRSHFEYIHRGVILVNTARGSVIAELDLCEALGQGWVLAAGLDVFEKEPLPKGSRLFEHAQLVFTPHNGANTMEAFHKSSELAALKALRFFVDGSTSDTLPPKAAWYSQPNPWV